jgi:hypothetical protein
VVHTYVLEYQLQRPGDAIYYRLDGAQADGAVHERCTNATNGRCTHARTHGRYGAVKTQQSKTAMLIYFVW